MERRSGMELRDIFEMHGQDGFRRMERQALEATLEEGGPVVLAAGGGIVAEPATLELLLAKCLTVWVRASPEEHMQRVVTQGDDRPMRDNADAMADLRAILTSREALYARADIVLDNHGRPLGGKLGGVGAEARVNFPLSLSDLPAYDRPCKEHRPTQEDEPSCSMPCSATPTRPPLPLESRRRTPPCKARLATLHDALASAGQLSPVARVLPTTASTNLRRGRDELGA